MKHLLNFVHFLYLLERDEMIEVDGVRIARLGARNGHLRVARIGAALRWYKVGHGGARLRKLGADGGEGPVFGLVKLGLERAVMTGLGE